ncbi:hypothetical protein ACFLRY_02005 [Bacteroidota bacterium]
MKTNKTLAAFILSGIMLLTSCSNNQSYATESKPKKPEIDHYSIVRNYADQVAEKFMTEICPNTGKNSYAVVTDYYYDSYHKRYEIKIEAYWTGKTWALGEYQKFEIDGTINVFADRDWDFDVYYKNYAVKKTMENNRLLGIAAITVGTLVVLSEYE